MGNVSKRVRKCLTIGCLMAAAVLVSGMAETKGVAVEESYRVQHGDTAWDIAELYTEKNTYKSRYVLEVKEEIMDMNPWMKTRCLQPGDVVKVRYWVKVEK